jgi:hypothetical protein|tara:strand:+ start:15830 stop:16393 length:564 start_codon:yes stop_codon:yes gene_type:complete
MTEQKLFYTVFATLLVYGLGSLFQLGSFVLPLPFFETGFLLICTFLAFQVWKENKTLSGVFILYGLFQFLGLEYNYSFFLSDEKLENLSQSLVTDIFKILAHLLLIPILYLQNRKQTIEINRTEFTLSVVLIAIILFLSSPLWLIIPATLIIRNLVKTNKLFQNSGSFWLYIPLFILARELSLYFLS